MPRARRKTLAKAAPVPRRTRADKTEATRRALIEAALHVIGEGGYAEASIARITARAGVAQGTFYNYFATQQDLFDQLLPQLGQDLLDRIRDRIAAVPEPAAKEETGFVTFFEHLLEVPEFYRVLNEAEIFAPQGHRRHVENMISGYVRALARARQKGALGPYDQRELEAVAYMLIAVRHYLAMRYTYWDGGVQRLPRWVGETYMKLLRHGLFAPEERAPRRAGRQARSTLPEIAGEERPTVEAATPGRAQLALTVGPSQLDSSGRVRRSVLTELAEQAALRSLGRRDEGLGLVSLTLTQLKPAQDGRLIALAQAQERGATLAFAAVELRQEATDGQLLVTAQLTFRNL